MREAEFCQLIDADSEDFCYQILLDTSGSWYRKKRIL